MFEKVVICGVGLIGGSFAAALKQAQAARKIVGVVPPGRAQTSLQQAVQLGLLDEASDNWQAALQGADLFLLATPVGQFDNILQQCAPHLEPQTIVTDAGSTKQNVVAVMSEHLADSLQRVVPAHPIAGAETSGPQAAQANLYQGRKVILTPLAETAPEAIRAVQAAWEVCGAQVHTMNAQQHDAVFAAVSHLPHVLAFALVHELAGRSNQTELFNFAGSGFRDFTRIAASHPQMWRDICLANQPALLGELNAYIEQLNQLRGLLRAQDANGLEKIFTHASQIRQQCPHK